MLLASTQQNKEHHMKKKVIYFGPKIILSDFAYYANIRYFINIIFLISAQQEAVRQDNIPALSAPMSRNDIPQGNTYIYLAKKFLGDVKSNLN